MNWDLIHSVLGEINMPAIICENSGNFPIAYMNTNAEIYFHLQNSKEKLDCQVHINLIELVQPHLSQGNILDIAKYIQKTGNIKNQTCEICVDGLQKKSLSLSGNLLSLDVDDDYILMFFNFISTSTLSTFTSEFMELFRYSLYNDDVDHSIRAAIEMAGRISSVSRVCIYEKTSEDSTRNTYEWCADGIPPIDNEQKFFKKNQYKYSVLLTSDVFACNDISTLPDHDRILLEPQGTKSIVITPLYLQGRTIGHMGFDICNQTHEWSTDEVEFLQNVSQVILSLISRRDAERTSRESISLLQLVCDNSDDLIYVRDLETGTLLMVNKALQVSVGKTADELLGKKCWEILQGRDSPCDLCPINEFSFNPDDTNSQVYEWEYYNENLGRHFKIKDCLVHWQNGRLVHMETATDITNQKAYERELRQLASTDPITLVSNRTWGSLKLRKKLDAKENGYLCFIDVDGLKSVNDNFGHQAGDEMLTEMVKIIDKHLAPEDFICRWGGDEFLIWLHGSEEYATRVMSSITDYIHKLNQESGRIYALSFSYGTIFFGNEQFDTLISTADNLMYEHKMKKRKLLKRRRRDDVVDERLL